tara:strand:+ start:2079 stop:3086 length:1008 start_codon:yes stop_codon:yes gene_type:complete
MLNALNTSEQNLLPHALNAASGVPEWVELIPAGPRVEGVDLRWWMMTNPQRVLDVFEYNRKSADLVVDYEHGQEKLASAGHSAPAAGWIKELEIRDGAIWGRVKWTDRAANHIRDGEYRYMSPVILYETESREIVGIKSVALVNQPNLSLKALNRRDHNQETVVNLSKLREALGLSDDADETKIVAAVNSLKSERDVALNRSTTPDTSQYVPMATYNTALNRAQAAEQKLAEHETASKETEIETAINSALKDGKIAPADKEFYTASCRAEGGLESFKTFLKTKQPVVETKPTDTDKQPDKSDTKIALNRAQQEVAAAMGLSEAEMAEILKEEEAA